jgi:chromosome segregation ATPase
MAALIAVIWIGQSLRRSSQESRLIEQLSQAAKDADERANRERDRADEMSDRLMKVNESYTRTETMLRQVEQRMQEELTAKAVLQKKVEGMEFTMEQLVSEIRYKDKSISELVKLNRQLLATLPRNVPLPALPKPQPPSSI